MSNQSIELSCDESVARSFGEAQKSFYAGALVDMEEHKNNMPCYNSISTCAAEERVTAIMKYKQPTTTAIEFASVLIIAIIMSFAFGASSNVPIDIEEDLNLSADTQITLTETDADHQTVITYIITIQKNNA